MNLRLTAAGREALASSEHVGTAAVRLTHFAIGDGQGPGGAADDGRAALRSERDRAPIEGTPVMGARIAFRADLVPGASYGITEAGVFGTAGEPAGPLTLYAYWSDGGTQKGAAAAGTDLVLAAVLELQSSEADVEVTVAATIELGADPDEASETEFGLTRYSSGSENDRGTATNRSVTPKGMRDAAPATAGSLVSGQVREGTVYQLKGKAGNKLGAEERTLPDATKTRKGLAELATSAEAQAGTDETRIVTPRGMRDATSHNLESLLAAAIENGRQYVLEGKANGRLALVARPFERLLRVAGGSVAAASYSEQTRRTNWPPDYGDFTYVRRVTARYPLLAATLPDLPAGWKYVLLKRAPGLPAGGLSGSRSGPGWVWSWSLQQAPAGSVAADIAGGSSVGYTAVYSGRQASYPNDGGNRSTSVRRPGQAHPASQQFAAGGWILAVPYKVPA